MKEDKYTKSLAKNQVYAVVHTARYSEKRFTEIYKTFNGDAMQIWPPETNRNICF